MFPSPYGDFVFQRNAIAVWTGLDMVRFRPLTGILFFNEDALWNHLLSGHGFRPLTGILFFNMKKEEAIRVIAIYSFRPLTGILFFNESKWLHNNPSFLAFPSPYGDFVFQHGIQNKLSHQKVVSVSVPLRGFCFSTTFGAWKVDLWEAFVSVPLRGFCFSTQERALVLWQLHIVRFPSPYGDFVFQHEQRRGYPCYR